MAQTRIGTEGKPKRPVFYFLTLETLERVPHFKDKSFKTRVELKWTEIMRPLAGIGGEEYVVNDHALHALIVVRDEENGGLKVLKDAISRYRAATQEMFGKEELWARAYKLRRISGEEELRSLREFIVQKMLGGEELSSSGDDELDEDFD